MFLVGNTVPYSYQELVLPDGGRVRFDRITPGWNLTNLVYKNTSTLGEFFGATITHTFFRWVLTRRDGTVFLFKEALDFSGPRDTALLSITDRNGNIVTIDRRSDNTISRVTSPNGRYIDFTYDTSQRITHLQDNIGREVDYVYDAAGRLTQVTDVNDGVWVYDYDPANRMTGIHDARNILYLQNQYDANDRVILQTQADNGTYEFDYTTDANGVITQTDITDPRGHVRRLVFYVPPASPNGFVSGGYDATDTFAYGTSLESTLTTLRQVGTNLPISRTDSSGRVTSLTYDSQGNVTSVTRLAGTPNAITSRFTHDATFGKITSVTDPLNHTTTFSYDTHGNLVSALDPLGNRTSWTYNAAGQVLTATDPNGNTTTFGYTAGNLTSITDPLGRSVSFTYDNVGRRLTTSTSQGISAQEYNSLNLVTRITDPLLGVTDLTYDGNGNVLTVKDARNNTTTYTYNNMDRLETRQDSLLAMENFLYDAKGSLTQATDRRGKITTYTYDELDRPVFVGFGTQVGPTYESSIAFTYDTASRLNVLTDSVAGIMTRDYDDLDRLISETTSAGIVSYSYDDADRRSSATVTGQPTIQYTYDDADRLTLIEQGSSTVAFAYDAGGRRTSLTLPSGIVTRYSYDAASQLIELAYQAGSTPLGDLTYGYDSQGQRIAMGGAYAQTSLPNPLSSATYNINNQLTDWGGNPHSYDANGNLLSDGTNTYTWNARNELSSITGGVTANFQYDPFGRRRSKSVGGNVTDYLYDGANIIQELDGSTPVANLLVGDVDELFRRTEASGFSDVLADALGSPIALLDSELSIQTRYIYGPFGDTTVSGIGNSNSAQFTGRENDGTGLYYYRARYYSPTSQRFLSEDPIEFSGGQVNLYSYVGSDPISFTDPTGECAPWCIGAAIGGGMDLAIQLIENGGNIKCVNWWSVAGNAALGALGGGLGGKALTGYLRGLNMQSKKVIGETLSLVENRLKFARLVSQNRKSIPGFGTIVDSTWDSFRGARYYVESKFGTSPLSKLQKIAAANLPPEVYHVERWGYPFFERVGAYVGGTTGAIVGEEMPGRGCGCQ
jgi:RHS repeat-associated protein